MLQVYLSMLPFCFQDFGLSLLSLFWILLHLDSLFPPHLFGLVNFYLVPSTTGYFSVFSFSLVYCVLSLLSPDWKFIVPLNCGVTTTFRGWIWISACEGFPGWGESWGRVVCLCFGQWSWILSLWRAVPCPVLSLGISMGLVLLWVACLLMCNIVFLFYWKNWHGAYEHWGLLAFGWAWFWCWDGGLSEGSCLLVFPGVSSSLVDQNLGLESHTSGVQAQSLL